MPLYEDMYSTTDNDFDPQAAFEIEQRLIEVPTSGRFILPLCVTLEELQELISEINRIRSFSPNRLYKARDAILQALPYINRANPLCDCGCDECEDCDCE